MKYRVKITGFKFGVPASFIGYNYNAEQFEIITIGSRFAWSAYKDSLLNVGFNPAIASGGGLGIPMLNNKPTYTRILIKFR